MTTPDASPIASMVAAVRSFVKSAVHSLPSLGMKKAYASSRQEFKRDVENARRKAIQDIQKETNRLKDDIDAQRKKTKTPLLRPEKIEGDMLPRIQQWNDDIAKKKRAVRDTCGQHLRSVEFHNAKLLDFEGKIETRVDAAIAAARKDTAQAAKKEESK